MITNRRPACAFSLLFIGQVKLSKLSPEHLQRLYSRPQVQGYHRAALKAHCLLHCMLELATLWGWAADNPADRVIAPSYRLEEKRLWTVGELRLFLASANGHPLFPLWAFLLASRCRLGEALGLKWSDIDSWTGR